MVFLRFLVVFLILLNVSFTQQFTLSEDGYHQVDFPLSSSLVDINSYLSTQNLSSSIDIMWT
ncbi:MAG: hypothetical protein KC646_17690, partial [Candidatus Cloacimonetes bacterium]|nr:hypothetical protein [Candidatus Cloacimonadota bacterium]